MVVTFRSIYYLNKIHMLIMLRELSGSTLAALQEFYSERESQQTRFENLKAAIDGKEKLSMNSFSEDWNVSQFWVLSGN